MVQYFYASKRDWLHTSIRHIQLSILRFPIDRAINRKRVFTPPFRRPFIIGTGPFLRESCATYCSFSKALYQYVRRKCVNFVIVPIASFCRNAFHCTKLVIYLNYLCAADYLRSETLDPSASLRSKVVVCYTCPLLW